MRLKTGTAGWLAGASGIALLMVMMLPPGTLRPAAPLIAQPPAAAFASLPLSFEPRAAQAAAGAQFLARAPGYSVLLNPAEVAVNFTRGAAALRLHWLGADPAATGTAHGALPGARHYFLGADAARWRRDIQVYGRVEYQAVYPGIDMFYYGRDGRLEFDWVVAPGADPGRIRLQVEGARHLAVTENGTLQLHSGDDTLVLNKPVIYQTGPGGRRAVDGGYVLRGGDQVSLWLGEYDTSRPLIIDPVLVYGSYLGGSGAEQAGGVAVDGSGNVYLTGQTASSDFPVNGALQAAHGGGTDAFVAKLDSSGALVYVSYLGGAGTDRGFAVAVDASGAAYVAGDTASSDFPTQNPKQAARLGSTDAFAAKLSADGATLVYSTYLGGSVTETARAVVVNGAGQAYVAGGTTSANFPVTAGVAQGSIRGDADANGIYKADGFVTQLSADGASAVFSTYWGGNDVDSISAIALTSAGEVVVAGGTASQIFPITATNLYDILQGFPEDAFISRLSAGGTSVLYSTYFGGDSWDRAYALAVDGADNIYIAGVTVSGNLPVTPGALQSGYGGGRGDAFAAKINAAGSSIIYATYLGGDDFDEALGLALAADGGVLLTGDTASANFPLALPLQFARFGNQDAFVSKLNATGTALDWSTYLGGGGDDAGAGVALSGAGAFYVTGLTASTDFPALNAAQASAAGGGDVFLAGLNDGAQTADVWLSVTDREDPAPEGSTVNYDITVGNNGPSTASGLTLRSVIPDAFIVVAVTPVQGTCSVEGAIVLCEVGEIIAGGSTQLALALRARTGGTQTVSVDIIRTRQPDPDASNNSASAETIITVGEGGGASPALVLLAALAAWRRRGVPLRRR